MQLNFDASKVVPDAGGFGDPVPKSWYQLRVVESEVKENSKKCGEILSIQVEIMAGPYSGRRVFGNFNVRHTESPKAEEIGRAELSALCHAVGMVRPITDSVEIHNLPFWGRVGIEAGQPKPEGGTYPDKNKITQYKEINFVPPANQGINGEGGPAAAAPAASSGPANPFAPAAVAAAAAAAGGQPANPFMPQAAAPAPAAAPVAAAPVAAPSLPAAPALPTAPAAPAPFPPAGWLPHPEAPGYFYSGQEVLTEAQLRAKMAPPLPAAPSLPAAPALPTAPAAAAAPVAAAAPAVADPAAVAGTQTPPWVNPQ